MRLRSTRLVTTQSFRVTRRIKRSIRCTTSTKMRMHGVCLVSRKRFTIQIVSVHYLFKRVLLLFCVRNKVLSGNKYFVKYLIWQKFLGVRLEFNTCVKIDCFCLFVTKQLKIGNNVW